MELFCVFRVFQDEWIQFKLIAVASSLKKAKKIIEKNSETLIPDPPDNNIGALDSMNYENNYTHIGNRKDLPHTCFISSFGGFVIECIKLNELCV